MSVIIDGTSGVTTNSGTLVSTTDASISGLRVGKGAGAISTNTAVGNGALNANTTGTQNTANGVSALYSNTIGAQNTATGNDALYSNTTGSYNTANGLNALLSNTTGSENTANGRSALQNNTTGNYNTANGYAALNYNTTGSSNTANGMYALFNNTTGSENTALGYQAGYSNQTGAANTFIGYQAGYYTTGGPNGRNVFVGEAAGFNNTTGRWNTYLGHYAGQAMTTGQANTIIGRYDGNYGGLDIRTASNYIVLSDGDGNPRVVVGAEGRRVFRQSDSSDGAGFEGWTNWGNVSSTTFNLQTLFPESSIPSRGLNITLQIVTQSNSSNSSTYFVMAGRNPDGGNWQFNTIAAQTRGGATVTVTGANDSITLTFSVGAQFGRCMIRGITQT